MTMLVPLAGLFALTVPAIVALYFLKARRRNVPISSTLLWRRATLDQRATMPWQRLRFSWLLLLQVLAALLITGALVRPALATSHPLGGTTVVVVDASLTMQATDVAPSRFAVAKRDASALVDQLGPAGRIALVAMDAHPRILASATADHTTLHRALAALQVSNGPADLQGAVQLAVAAAGAAADTRLVVLSDGITAPVGDTATLPFAVDYRRIGVSAENLAITSLTVSGGAGATRAVVHVQNFGRQSHPTTVELVADGRVVDARVVAVAADAGRDVDLAVPAGADNITATLGPHDILAIDDAATAVVGSSRKSRVLLVTPGNVFLAQALALRDDLAVTVVAPSAYRPDPGVDLYVFDRFVPPALPTAPYLLVDPPPAAGQQATEVSPGRLLPAESGAPLLADVDLSDVHVARARALAGSDFGRPVIEAATGPVLLVRDAPTVAALLGFDLHESDLPLRAAFPILVRNLTEFLDPPATPATAQRPGTPVQFAVGAAANQVSVMRPDGQVHTLPRDPAASTVVDTDTGEVGLYRVTVRDRSGAPTASEFVVNAGDVASSAVAPRERIALAGTAQAAGARSAPGHHDVWPWLVWIALAVLLAEWVVFHRAA